MSAPYDLTYLSLGAGVQSTAVLAMSTLGLHGCPRADVAIFADTCDEPEYVYAHLAKLKDWGGGRGMHVERVSEGRLSDKVLKGRPAVDRDRFVYIPAFVAGADGRGAPLRRQCTREFKIQPIERRVRELLGFAKGKVVRGKRALALMGISLDEAIRCRDNPRKWCTNGYPLIDARMRREDCLRLIASVGLPRPNKSACLYCPYKSNAEWRVLRDEAPADFARAIEFDERIRRLQIVRGDVYLHRSLKPLAQVVLDEQTGDLFANDCSGSCGV